MTAARTAGSAAVCKDYLTSALFYLVSSLLSAGPNFPHCQTKSFLPMNLGFSLLLQKVAMQKEKPAIRSFFFVTERAQLNAVHALASQKIAIEWKNALSEIPLFLENHSLEFHEIWHENK